MWLCMSLVHEQVFVTCASQASKLAKYRKLGFLGRYGRYVCVRNTYVKHSHFTKHSRQSKYTSMKQLALHIYLYPTFSKLKRCRGSAMLAMLGSVHWHVAAHHNELGGTAYLSGRYGAQTHDSSAHISKPPLQRRSECHNTSETRHTAIIFHLFMLYFFMQFTYHFREAQTQIVWTSTVYCSFFSQVLWLDSDQSQFLSTPSHHHHQHYRLPSPLPMWQGYHKVGVRCRLHVSTTSRMSTHQSYPFLWSMHVVRQS